MAVFRALSGRFSCYYEVMMYPRNIAKNILHDSEMSPVVFLGGPRQSGKSTLAKAIARLQGSTYITLDDPTMLAATANPKTFIDDLPERTIIDEIQRAPELLLPIKQSVDDNRTSGRFILTGSASVLTLPKLSESLVGRMLITTLAGLSVGELLSKKDGFVDWLFSANKLPIGSFPGEHIQWKQLCERITTGSFPELQKNQSEKDKAKWFRSYIQTLIERDIRELAQIEGSKDLPQLLRLLAARVGRTLNHTDVSREIGIPRHTITRYIALLEATYLISTIPAWFRNLGKRLTKSPKIYFSDTGLASHLLAYSADKIANDRTNAGFLLENFVASELGKQLSWSEVMAELYHFRTPEGQEVDFVLEGRDGQIIGIEIKCTNAVEQRDFKGLQYLAELAGSDFHRGVVLYTGKDVVSFDKKLQAMPISALWQLGSSVSFNIYE